MSLRFDYRASIPKNPYRFGMLGLLVAARNTILLGSLKSALGELNERLGPNMDSWAWGRLRSRPPATRAR